MSHETRLSVSASVFALSATGFSVSLSKLSWWSYSSVYLGLWDLVSCSVCSCRYQQASSRCISTQDKWAGSISCPKRWTCSYRMSQYSIFWCRYSSTASSQKLWWLSCSHSFKLKPLSKPNSYWRREQSVKVSKKWFFKKVLWIC